MSYADTLEMSGLEYLCERRLRLVDKFIIKCAMSERFSEKWFPKKEFVHMDLRKELVYVEKYARTSRLYDSPLYFYRRRLNEIHQHDLNKKNDDEPTLGVRNEMDDH